MITELELRYLDISVSGQRLENLAVQVARFL